MQIQVNKTIEETVNIQLPFFTRAGTNTYLALLDENTLVNVILYTYSGPMVSYGKPMNSELERIAKGTQISEKEFKAVFDRAIEQLTNIMQPQHGMIVLETPSNESFS